MVFFLPLLMASQAGAAEPIRARDLPAAATTVKNWVAQMEAAVAQVTAVQLNSTAAGLEIMLQTADGRPLRVDTKKFRTEGNALIAEIPAVLALPEGGVFASENVAKDVASVQVTQQDAGTIRVMVVGMGTVPQTAVSLKTGEVVYALKPIVAGMDEEGEEEIVVTAEQVQGGYRVPNTSTATRTDTPLRDIPQSIQVVPRQVLEDRGVRRELEALETVSGVIDIQPNLFDAGGVVNIRGFQSNTRLRNGLSSEGIFYLAPIPLGTVEQVEVLRSCTFPNKPGQAMI